MQVSIKSLIAIHSGLASDEIDTLDHTVTTTSLSLFPQIFLEKSFRHKVVHSHHGSPSFKAGLSSAETLKVGAQQHGGIQFQESNFIFGEGARSFRRIFNKPVLREPFRRQAERDPFRNHAKHICAQTLENSML